jgi:hypothetical protein
MYPAGTVRSSICEGEETMSTRLRYVVLAALAALLMAVPLQVSAQGPVGTWVSGIQIQNQSDANAAEVTVEFYWAAGQGPGGGGALAGTKTVSVPASQSVTFYIPDLELDGGGALPEGFVGSAVVKSTEQVTANVNTQVPTTMGREPDQPNRIGTAGGVLTPAPKLYFTQVMKNYWGWNSYIAVQNTGAEPADVTVSYYNDSNGALQTTQTATIPAFATHLFYQDAIPDDAIPAPSPGGWGGSAVVEGNQPLAGIANFYNAGTDQATAAFQSYNPFTAGATTLYVPRVLLNYYDYQGGIKVQNVGTAATTVTITYYFGTDTYTQVIPNLQPGAAYPVYMPDVAEVPDWISGHPLGSGAAVITSSDGVDIVATVNDDNRVGAEIAGHEGRGSTYNAIPAGEETTAVYFSQVTSKYYGYSGGIQVQNVGTEPANITATFSAPGFADKTVTATLQPNTSTSWYAPDATGYQDFNGSVVVTSNQPIVGIANNSHRSDTDTREPQNWGDSYSQYNGVNR